MNESALTRKYLHDPLKAALGIQLDYQKIVGTAFNKGIPDVNLCFRGRSVRIEVKKYPNYDPTPLQRTNLKSHMLAGGLSLLLVFNVTKKTMTWVRYTDPAQDPKERERNTALYFVILSAIQETVGGRWVVHQLEGALGEDGDPMK